jgi:hypothetical protein
VANFVTIFLKALLRPTTVAQAAQKIEISRITVRGQLGQNVREITIPSMAGRGGM